MAVATQNGNAETEVEATPKVESLQQQFLSLTEAERNEFMTRLNAKPTKPIEFKVERRDDGNIYLRLMNLPGKGVAAPAHGLASWASIMGNLKEIVAAYNETIRSLS